MTGLLVLLICVLSARSGWEVPTKNGPEQPLWAAFDAAAALIAAVVLIRRRSGVARSKTVGELAILATLFFSISAIAHPVFESAKTASATARCVSNLKRLVIAELMYAGDYEDRLPPGSGWRSLSTPYRTAPDDPNRCPMARTPFTYAMNSAASRLSLAEVSFKSEIVLLFESDSEVSDAVGGKLETTARHGGRATIAFMDGQVQLRDPRPLHFDPTYTP